MKVTNSEVIKIGERELIDAINAELDWGVIEEVFREKHRLGIGDEIEFKDGDLVVHDDQIGYQLQFDVKIGLTLVVDREGNYLAIAGSVAAEGCEDCDGEDINGTDRKDKSDAKGHEDHDLLCSDDSQEEAEANQDETEEPASETTGTESGDDTSTSTDLD